MQTDMELLTEDTGVRERLVRMYRQMVAIRLFEERVNDLYTRALMPGPCNSCSISSWGEK